jgi:hypothetical protein
MSGAPTKDEFDDWVKARDAIARLAAHLRNDESEAAKAIIGWLVMGRLRCAAASVHRALGNRTEIRSHVAIPQTAWRNNGVTAQSSVWKRNEITLGVATGDPDGSNWTASYSDVRLEPIALEELLQTIKPAPKARSSDLDTVAAGVFETWLTPSEALATLSGLSNDDAKDAILKRAANGLVEAAARELFVTEGRERVDYELALIPAVRWRGLQPSRVDPFWRTGDWETELEVPNSYPVRRLELSFHEIRFAPAGIERLASTTKRIERDTKTPDPSMSAFSKLVDIDSLPPPRGRPPAAFWEDMILEIARTIHLGDFKPNSQAEVEDKMGRWIMAHGYKGGRRNADQGTRPQGIQTVRQIGSEIISDLGRHFRLTVSTRSARVLMLLIGAPADTSGHRRMRQSLGP